MTLSPIISSAWIVQIHILAAVLALFLGPFAIFRRSRDFVHKLFGYLWVLAMVTTAVTSFWIFGFRLVGPFSPIHFLSLFVLWSVAEAIWAIRHGDVRTHRMNMLQLYIWAVCVTGLATLLPGRTMNLAVLGGSDGWLTYTFLAVFAAIFAAIYIVRVLPLGKGNDLH